MILIGFLISLHQQRAEGDAFWPQSEKTDSSLTWSLTSHVLPGKTTLPFGIKPGGGTKEFLRFFLAQIFCISKFLVSLTVAGTQLEERFSSRISHGVREHLLSIFVYSCFEECCGKEGGGGTRQLLDTASQLKDFQSDLD